MNLPPAECPTEAPGRSPGAPTPNGAGRAWSGPWRRLFPPGAGEPALPLPFSLFYPDRGDFVAFVANLDSRAWVRRAVRTFLEVGEVPSEGVAAPASLPGMAWSDHASFWLEGYPAIMISDTAPFRNEHYHTVLDTPDRLDYGRLARMVDGVERVVRELAEVGP